MRGWILGIGTTLLWLWFHPAVKNLAPLKKDKMARRKFIARCRRWFRARNNRFYNSNHLVRKSDGSKLPMGPNRRKRRVSKGKNLGYNNLHKKFCVDPVLQAIIGRPTSSRPEAVKLIWAYIKKNKLQKPENGRIILPDEKIAALTGEPGVEINGFKLIGHIQRHFTQPAPSLTLFQTLRSYTPF